MTPSQRFYPTSWGFHPSGGSTAQLFNQGAHPARAARAGVCERPPGVFPGGRSWWGRGARSQAWAPWWGCGSPVELSCPVSAASTASAAAPSPAGRRPASAGRTAAAGGTPAPAAGGATRGTRVVPARGRAVGPPAVAATPPVTAATAVAVTSATAPHTGYERCHQHDSEHDQDDAHDHGATLLPLPGLAPGVPPKPPPVGRLAL